MVGVVVSVVSVLSVMVVSLVIVSGCSSLIIFSSMPVAV